MQVDITQSVNLLITDREDALDIFQRDHCEVSG